MSLSTLSTAPTLNYSITMIKDEVRQLVEQGTINRNQPIYTLCQYIPPREWVCVECELERCENWDND